MVCKTSIAGSIPARASSCKTLKGNGLGIPDKLKQQEIPEVSTLQKRHSRAIQTPPECH